MSLKMHFQPDRRMLVVTDDKDEYVMREFPCMSHGAAVRLAGIINEAHALGYQQCVKEVKKANAFLNNYGISGIQIPKAKE